MKTVVASVAILLLSVSTGLAEEPAAAVVMGRTIPLSEVDAKAGNRLLAIRNQEYAVRRQVLEDLISEELLQQEAKRRRVSVAELLAAEVDGKVSAVTAAEVQQLYDREKARLGNLPETEARAQLEARLRKQKAQERRRALLKDLKARAAVQVLLEPSRIEVASGNAPGVGPADAQVTIVEFSDYECPYCARVEPTLKALRQRYGDRLRIVFRDFPLAMHRNAAKASEAAHCAGEQGKFWPMHEKLFASQKRLAVPDLKGYAADLGLNGTAFAECLDSGKFATKVQASLAEGSGYGVTGTPAFFINGRFLSGAQGYESFARIIDDEIDLAERRSKK